MTKGRETTQAERITVAKACIANGKNYGEVAIAYNVSYQQARSWTLKYIEGGEAALEDRAVPMPACPMRNSWPM